ncbi:MAG: hypothetical protein ACP5H5_05720 [Pyrobaculum sp.]
MRICVTSGAKGGTGKSTFAELMAFVWRALGNPARVVKPLSGSPGSGLLIVDFPAFQLTDRRHMAELLRCDSVIYVADEDYQTLASVEVVHAIARRPVLGVVLNKVIKRPGRDFLRQYSRLGEVHVVRFDEKMAVHRAVGVPPYRVRSIATLDMAKAAVKLYKCVDAGKR